MVQDYLTGFLNRKKLMDIQIIIGNGITTLELSKAIKEIISSKICGIYHSNKRKYS